MDINIDKIKWDSKKVGEETEVTGRLKIGGRSVKVTFTGSGEGMQEMMGRAIADIGAEHIIAMLGQEVKFSQESFANTELLQLNGKRLETLDKNSPLYKAALRTNFVAYDHFGCVPPSISNESNWCYASSTFQLLFSSGFFFEKVAEYRRKRNPDDFEKAVISLHEAAVRGSGVVEARQKVITAMRRQAPNFKFDEPNDAAEFQERLYERIGYAVNSQSAHLVVPAQQELAHAVSKGKVDATSKSLMVKMDRFAGKTDRSDLKIPSEVENNGVRYRLKGIQFQIKDDEKGHYYSYVRRGNRWFHVDDASVKKISQKDVDNEKGNGYIFHYERA